MELNQNIVYDLTADDWWENISVYWQGSYTLADYDREILLKRLKKKFIRILKIDEEMINEELHLLNDLHLDPVDLTFLVCVLECEYDLKSSNRLACQIDTVGDLLNYCEQTWPSRDLESWFPDPLLPEPEPKTRVRRVLKTVNKVRFINKLTTFVRTLFKRSPNPLRKYIIQGRRRWIKIEEEGIHPSQEVLDRKWANWELWNEQDWIDWYGSKWPIYQEECNRKIKNNNSN